MIEPTEDTLFNGRLKIRQPASGYRFSADALLLARWATLKPSGRVLDLGCGCGIIALILGYRYPGINIYGVEIQSELADIASLNIAENKMQERITIFNRDLKTLTTTLISGPVDAVICNPPHGRAKSRRTNPDPRLAVARHEVKMTSDDLMITAERMLRPDGRMMTIYPAQRMPEILAKMRALHLEPKRLTMVHTKPDSNAIRFLVEGVKGGGPGLNITPPINMQNLSAGDDPLHPG